MHSAKCIEHEVLAYQTARAAGNSMTKYGQGLPGKSETALGYFPLLSPAHYQQAGSGNQRDAHWLIRTLTRRHTDTSASLSQTKRVIFFFLLLPASVSAARPPVLVRLIPRGDRPAQGQVLAHSGLNECEAASLCRFLHALVAVRAEPENPRNRIADTPASPHCAAAPGLVLSCPPAAALLCSARCHLFEYCCFFCAVTPSRSCGR